MLCSCVSSCGVSSFRFSKISILYFCNLRVRILFLICLDFLDILFLVDHNNNLPIIITICQFAITICRPILSWEVLKQFLDSCLNLISN